MVRRLRNHGHAGLALSRDPDTAFQNAQQKLIIDIARVPHPSRLLRRVGNEYIHIHNAHKLRRQRPKSLASYYGKLAGYSDHASSHSALRSGSESPRNLPLQALPAMELRVASNLASFGATGGEAPSCP